MGRKKKTPIEKLDTELQKILDEYKTEIYDNMEKAIKKAAQKGRAALKSMSPKGPHNKPNDSKRKPYSQTWKITMKVTRLTAAAVIHNDAPNYRLTHLLEYGHNIVARGPGKKKKVTRSQDIKAANVSQARGKVVGRAAPKVHVEPVRETVTQWALENIVNAFDEIE